MRKVLDDLLGMLALLILLLVWPFTSGWKAVTGHRDILYDQMSVLFLSFVGLFLYVLTLWRAYEWSHHGHSGWVWFGVLALLFFLLSVIRGMLHIMGTGLEDEEEEAY